jgi:aspartate aminotransferase
VIEPLSDALVELLETQHRIDRLRGEAIRRVGAGLCDLAYANPYDGPEPSTVDAIGEALQTERTLDLQYTPYGGATITRRLVAGKLRTDSGLDYHWRDVVMTPGAMAALNVVFRAVRPDRGTAEVLMITPCWLDYPLYLTNLGLRPTVARVDRESGRLDLSAVEAALSDRTRAVILSQPANPTGVVYGREELEALADLLRSRPVPPVLISDEAHREVHPPDVEVCSPVEVYEQTCVVYSFGKSLFIQGQRIGYVAVSPRFEGREEVRDLFADLCRTMGFCTPTALMQLAVRKLIEHRPDFSSLGARRHEFATRLRELGYGVPPGDATFFLYPSLEGHDDLDFCERLARRGLLVLPAPLFHDAGGFRVSLTGTSDMMDRALDVLEAEA